jgi:L-seryl-tRNA(Ser) seleniumtransferase
VSAPDALSRGLRLLPSVEEVLQLPAVAALEPRFPRSLVLELVRQTLDAWRAEIKERRLPPGEVEARLAGGGLERAVLERAAAESRKGLRRAVNATGVVLHTGLGRAPVHPEVARAMAEAAGGYSILEVERESGARGERDAHLGELLARLSGAEAGIAVNNNAAAVYLVLHAFASPERREVVVSRGELVEIGGSFRIPDVMAHAGVVLREVGTTNRTRIADYRAAAGPRTALLMKVHTSNFRVEGFVQEVEARELAELGRELALPTAFDLGSGLLEGPGCAPIPGLEREPRVREALASGVDVVTFSGDKLLGAPQAGLVVGKRQAVALLRKSPVYRALRLDKVAIAGLERTLDMYLTGRGEELPARAMLRLTADELRPRAEELARRLAGLAGVRAEVAKGESQPGSGSAPGVMLPTWVVRVRRDAFSAETLAAALRRGDPPVFARIQDDALVLDPRTLLPGDQDSLVRAFETLG